MFDDLKRDLENKNEIVNEAVMLTEMAEGGAPEDDVMDSLAIPEDDDKEIESLVNKVPGTPFKSDEKLTDADLDSANSVEDPTIDELMRD